VLLMIVALSDLAHTDSAGQQLAQSNDAPGVAAKER